MNAANLPLIVSYFTNDWCYPAHAMRLANECEALGLDYRIEELPSRGGYIQNSCHKPAFILRCLKESKRPVLWVDVDGSIYAPPTFFLEPGFDFQARKMNPLTRRRIWHVGTLWFAPTEASMEFIEAWVARTGDMTDESALDQVWKSKEWPLRTRDIPAEYFHILPRNERPPAGTVIAHRLSDSASKRAQTAAFESYERLIG